MAESNRPAVSQRDELTHPVGAAFFGRFAHTPSRGALEILNDTLVLVDDKGMISSVLPPADSRFQKAFDQAKASGRLIRFGEDATFLPGMVDLHVHAPQWPQLGRALHLPLDEWLNTCTFPLEAQYRDGALARSVYPDLVAALLANGTTTAVYFSTIHMEASQVLAEVCLQAGQRAFIGKVVMDDPKQCPDDYRDASTGQAIGETERFIDFVRHLSGNGADLVQPMVTPRFIPSCTHSALLELGRVAEEMGCRVQTHCSEGDWEHQFVLERYGQSDTAVLSDLGLLRRGSVLAHCNFVSPTDMEMIKAACTGIAHCPLSNAYFANSVFPLRRALDAGVNVGMGTDISAGPSPSIFENARFAIAASRMLEEGVDPAVAAEHRGASGSRIDFREALWIATAGGAQVLDIPVGLFEKGRYFDAILVNHRERQGASFAGSGNDGKDLIQSLLYNVSRSDIRCVWVNGRVTHSLDAPLGESGS